MEIYICIHYSVYNNFTNFDKTYEYLNQHQITNIFENTILVVKINIYNRYMFNFCFYFSYRPYQQDLHKIINKKETRYF